MEESIIIDYINKKIQKSEDEDFIRYTFYELRVKNNLSETELNRFFIINKKYLEKQGYNVYFTGAKYTYKNERRIVKDNELMIAIKEE